MNEIELVVVWNGTRAQGPYLVTEYDEPHAPTPVERARGLQDQVRDQLAVAGPMSMREIAHALCLDIAKVNGALWPLRQSGEVRIVTERWNERRHQSERIYGLADETAAPVAAPAPAPAVPPPSAATLRARTTTGTVVAPHYDRIWSMLATPTSARDIAQAIGAPRRPVHVMLHRAIRSGVVERADVRPTGNRGRGRRLVEATFTRAAAYASSEYMPVLARSVSA